MMALSVLKRREAFGVVLRVEIFNAFNHTQFTGINSLTKKPLFRRGEIVRKSSALEKLIGNGAATVQLQDPRYCGGASPLGNVFCDPA
jgi:hypothetical protein